LIDSYYIIASNYFEIINSLLKLQQGSLPLLAPPSQQWGGRPGSSGPQQSKPMPTAPRFMNSSNRFQELAEEKDRGNRLNSNQQPPSSLRDSMPSAQSPYATNTYISTPTRRISPPISNASSRENSRPVSPKDTPPLSMINNECTADVPETVKNIFEEFCSGANTADTLDWIKQRFPGKSNPLFYIINFSSYIHNLYIYIIFFNSS
jgi:hypothetical protein